MEFANYRPEWLETLKAQEALLRLESLNSDEAMRLGTIMVRLAKEKYKKPAAMRIITGGQVTFSFLMDGAGRWSLAPFDDFTRAEGPNGWHTLSVAGEGRDPGESDLMRLAEEAGLSASEAREELDRVRAVKRTMPCCRPDCLDR